MITALFLIAFVSCLGLFFVVTLIQGLMEIGTAYKLSKCGESTTGRVQYVDIKSMYGGGVYGKVSFAYNVNDVTYTKEQTADKYTATGLLSGSKDVIVLFLPKKPSVARLALAPSDHMRIKNLIWLLVCLGIMAAVVLLSILLNMRHNY